MPSLLLPAIVLMTLPQEGTAAKPWVFAMTSEQQYQSLSREQRKPEARFLLARWCAQRGLFVEMEKEIEGVLAVNRDDEEAQRLLGRERTGSGWTPEELRRFSVSLPELRIPDLAGIASKERELARGRVGNEIKLARRSGGFHLWSDLESELLKPYGDLLNEHYDRLKNRFQPHPGGDIDVLLFGNWSDFLYFFRRNTGKGGENVGGYYIPAARLLVLVDDPYDRDQVRNIVKHECTHLLIDLSYSGAAVPRWLHEGLACFLAGNGMEVSGRYTAGLILTLMDQLATGSAATLETLLELDQFEYAHYATSWSWIYYLNRDATAGKFRRFMSDLRDKLSPEDDAAKGRATARAVLKSAFGADLSQHQTEWKSFFLRDFVLSSTPQLLDLGWAALDKRAETPEAKRRFLETAHAAFDAVALGEAPDARARLGLLATAVERFALDKHSPATCRLALRTVIEGLRGLPQEDDEYLKAHVAHKALWAVRKSLGLPEKNREPFDFRKALLEKSLSKSDVAEQRALAVLCDDALLFAFEALARTLQQNPLHRLAAYKWLWLAMDFCPAALPQIFETLRLLVEADPGDCNLAALGVAYAGLGRRSWGTMLFEEAKRLAVDPRHVADFAPYFD
ncbi:MAG: hypothetical protein AB1486_20520 [Planctomycetota bacterium]